MPKLNTENYFVFNIVHILYSRYDDNLRWLRSINVRLVFIKNRRRPIFFTLSRTLSLVYSLQNCKTRHFCVNAQINAKENLFTFYVSWNFGVDKGLTRRFQKLHTNKRRSNFFVRLHVMIGLYPTVPILIGSKKISPRTLFFSFPYLKACYNSYFSHFEILWCRFHTKLDFPWVI